MKIVYKVVVTRNGHKCSAATAGRGSLRYFKSRWTKPTIPNSLIFVFSSLEFAEDAMPGYDIWESVTPETFSLLGRTWSHAPFNEKKEFWNKQRGPKWWYQHPNHRGTVGCKKLKLVRKIN